jgi:hypothetical protein
MHLAAEQNIEQIYTHQSISLLTNIGLTDRMSIAFSRLMGACGKFAAIRSGGPGKATDYQSSLICECGGKFEREKVLFCNECRSKNLSNDMEFIT